MDYFDPTKFETWRPNYEAHQTAMWLCGAGAYAWAGSIFEAWGVALTCSACCAVMALTKAGPAKRRHDMTMRLAGTPIPFIDFEDLKKMLGQRAHRNDLWIGRGFTWGPAQTQRINEILKRPDWNEIMEKVLGKALLYRYLKRHFLFTLVHPFQSIEQYREGKKRVADQPGYTWIHGVGDAEEDKFVPISHLEGHTFIVGTTGSGKTRCFDLFISQAVLRGETVIIIDPKGDKDMMEKAQRACEMLGRGDKFVSFHPAFPDQSVRINLLANYTKPTDLADRIAALIPSEGASASFQAFCFWALKAICASLILVGEKPTLKLIKHYLTGTQADVVARLVIDVVGKYVRQTRADGEQQLQAAVDGIKKGELTRSNVALAYIAVYNDKKAKTDADVDDLIAMFTHPNEHFHKMTTNLLPVLTMLTSGKLGDMLSPEESSDHVHYQNTGSLIKSNAVVYVGLDSLSSPLVGSAIGSLFLADLTSVAGSRYNFPKDPGEHEKKPGVIKRVFSKIDDAFQEPDRKNHAQVINLFVDEASEVANRPFLQLLNKGRGAGFRLFVATQTVADFEAKMGSAAAARQFISNMNNKICLRTVDPDTQKFMVEILPKTKVQVISRGQGLSVSATQPIPSGGATDERLSEEEADLFAPPLLGMLPNLEYIAIVSSGHVIKGRYPLILKDKKEYRPA